MTVENKAATRKMIDHLIEEHGRRSIIFLRGPYGQEDSHWREQGYVSSLEAHGIPVNPNLILDGEFDGSIAYKTIQNLLVKNHKSFDAIFTGDDDAAIGVLTALNEAGIRVPEDVAVVGFDDSRLSSFLNPPLSTVRAPTQEVGQVATQQLFRLLREECSEPETLLPTEIVLRRSCGCMYAAQK